MNFKERAKKLKASIPAVFLTLKDDRTPLTAKILAGITICYAFSPIDLIPDFIPVLGYLDDIILLPLLISLTIHFIPHEIWKDNCDKAQSLKLYGDLKKWYFSIPIILIWIIIAILVINIRV